MAAAAGQHVEVLELLLDKDASINSTGHVATSALSIAADACFKEGCLLLVGRGARLRNANEDESAADVLKREGELELLAEAEPEATRQRAYGRRR